MSLVDWLMDSRSKLELAKELAQTARAKAELENRVFHLEHELFWMKAAERAPEPVLAKDRWDSFSKEAQFHKLIGPLLTKREQGYVMGAFRELFTQA